MAARNPTDFTRWLDEQAMARAKNIVLTEPNKVFNDLQWLRDMPRLIASMTFRPYSDVGPGPSSGQEQFRIRLHNKDLGGTGAATTPVSWTARVWSDPGTYGAGVSLSDGTTTDSAATAAATTTPTWLPLQTGYVLQTNGTDVDLIVSLYEDDTFGGADEVFISNLLIFAEET